jgi:hypothetical protein
MITLTAIIVAVLPRLGFLYDRFAVFVITEIMVSNFEDDRIFPDVVDWPSVSESSIIIVISCAGSPFDSFKIIVFSVFILLG